MFYIAKKGLKVKSPLLCLSMLPVVVFGVVKVMGVGLFYGEVKPEPEARTNRGHGL